MRIIPEDIRDDVIEVTKNIVKYTNPNKSTWAKAYDDILIQMGKENQLKNVRLLNYVVKRITDLGNDINDNPFRLTKYT